MTLHIVHPAAAGPALWLLCTFARCQATYKLSQIAWHVQALQSAIKKLGGGSASELSGKPVAAARDTSLPFAGSASAVSTSRLLRLTSPTDASTLQAPSPSHSWPRPCTRLKSPRRVTGTAWVGQFRRRMLSWVPGAWQLTACCSGVLSSC